MPSQKKTSKSSASPNLVEFSLTVSRALGILSLFSPSRPELGLAEISRDTKLSKPSVLRFMQAMLMHGYVEQDEQSKKYRPGIETFRIGTLVGERGIRTVALPVLRALSEETGFSTYMSVLRADKMVIMASVEGGGPLRLSAPVGEMISVHNTSTGQAALSMFDDEAVTDIVKNSKISRTTASAPATKSQLLEKLQQVRAQGYALSWEMSVPGVGSVAAPVTDANGRLAAVCTLGFGTGQVSKADCPRLGAKIKAAARNLSAALSKSAGLTE